MSYVYYRAITIDHTKVPGNLTSHPFLFNTTHNDLRTVANGGRVTSASGYDIVFSPNPDGSAKYSHEIEKYVAATGEFVAHVKIPAVSSTVPTVFYIVYGDAGVTTTQEDITGVWDSDFKLIQHLNEASNPYLDSTSNNNDSDAGTYPTLSASGQVDGAQDFESDDSEYISIPDAASLDITAAFTSEVWVKLETLPSVQGAINFIYDKRQASTPDPIENYGLMCHNASDPTDQFHFQAWVGGWKTASWGIAAVVDTWYYVVVVYDGTNVKISVDNAAFVVGSATASLTANTGALTLGKVGAGGPSYWDGLMDEFRFSSIARSSDYRTATYNSQLSPSTFYALGTEQIARGPRSGVTFSSMIGIV